eukprot:TRINITY_DN66316_c0_g1_i1.p4 TRINITY_DN66316_c0_g1~~TRINITY_DN66316_c0_g1_i1.p4  ORF type:complete len:106 (-),score=7.84 TRINITY_DN66316_c0_g1_i1:257-574(-)
MLRNKKKKKFIHIYKFLLFFVVLLLMPFGINDEGAVWILNVNKFNTFRVQKNRKNNDEILYPSSKQQLCDILVYNKFKLFGNWQEFFVIKLLQIGKKMCCSENII